jgi:ribonuclease Y
MDIIGAAALIAVGIVLAAVLYGRSHGARLAVAGTDAVAPAPVEVDRPDRTSELTRREAELARREAELARREAELDGERDLLANARLELQRELERVSGMSSARAKQQLLKDIEEQATHDAARRIRQIEEQT